MKRVLGYSLRFCLLLVLFCMEGTGFAQGSKVDYERANTLDERTRNKVFRSKVNPHWSNDGESFWYRIKTGPMQFEFIFVEPDKGIRQPAFDHQHLAEALSKASKEDKSPYQLPFNWITLGKDGNVVRFQAFDKNWIYDNQSGQLRESKEDLEPANRLPARAEPYPSRQTGEQTSIQFINKTDGTVNIFWIDSSGEQRPYGSLEAGESREQNSYQGHVWLITDQKGKNLGVFECTADPADAIIDGTITAQRKRTTTRRTRSRGTSPDDKWIAFTTTESVHVKNKETEKAITLCRNGSDEDYYSNRMYWSPDSKKLIVMQIKKGEEREIHLIESSPKDQLQPKLHSIPYNKPGDIMPVPRPRLFDIESKQQIPVSDELFPNAWSINDVHWWPDSSAVVMVYNQRGHQVLRVVEINAETGKTRVIIDEQSDTFIDYAGKKYVSYLDDTHEIIWMSERGGWNHLYLYDAKTGKVKNQITQGEWVVRNVVQVDTQNRQIWFSAGGIYPEQDPYYLHLCRINFDGSNLTVLTKGNGNHRWEFGPNHQYIIDTWSRVDLPPVTELRRISDGRLVCELERADWSSLLETGWKAPERFVAKGRDGKTDIYGIIIRPTQFDPEKSYPVIEEIYAGPQSAYVPKDFVRYSHRRAIAELGFIVVKIDGMGTSHRSKAFHDVCWKNLGDAGFPDRIAWLKAAAEKYPQMDLDRVGIYGGSAGGQNALRGLLAHGDFYKVGVADCGCHDNRMDKIWWNELWMGWPVGPHYEEQSNVTNAHKLQGKLLLIVGELDRNVDPASTMQVVDALVKADKDFDLVIIPGQGHGSAETAYGKRRRMDFFVRHLLNVEPRWEG